MQITVIPVLTRHSRTHPSFPRRRESKPRYALANNNPQGTSGLPGSPCTDIPGTRVWIPAFAGMTGEYGKVSNLHQVFEGQGIFLRNKSPVRLPFALEFWHHFLGEPFKLLGDYALGRAHRVAYAHAVEARVLFFDGF